MYWARQPRTCKCNPKDECKDHMDRQGLFSMHQSHLPLPCRIRCLVIHLVNISLVYLCTKYFFLSGKCYCESTVTTRYWGAEEQKGKTSGIQHSAANEALVSKGKTIITNLETNKQSSSLGYKKQKMSGNSSEVEKVCMRRTTTNLRGFRLWQIIWLHRS